jgi:hypothetical protein
MTDKKENAAKEPPPDTLYHYCGVNAFHGIISSRTLWLSNAAFTNDYMEYKWLIDKALKRIEGKRASTKDHSALNRLVGLLSDGKPPYICCFAADRDMLSQWRAYSDDGEGFAIGFSGKHLRRLAEVGNTVRFSFQKASYDADEHQALVKYAVDEAVKRSNRSPMVLAFYATKITTHAAVCKNSGFKEEREWRMVFAPEYPKLKELSPEAKYDDAEPAPLSFRPAKGKLVPYYALPFKTEAIREICVGPKNYARDDHGFLKMFLAGNGFNTDTIEIVNSAATYR